MKILTPQIFLICSHTKLLTLKIIEYYYVLKEERLGDVVFVSKMGIEPTTDGS